MNTTNDTARENLAKIEHIVVLMMENRSFDHMLGYLKMDGMADVDGLDAEMGNADSAGAFHTVEPLGLRLINEKVLDPGHGASDVTIQLKDNNGGFIRSYERTLEENRQKYKYPAGLTFDPTLVLGYQTAGDVPVYDFIARQYAVCDRWFSSVPGPTWPNRQYAVSGGSGSRAVPKLIERLAPFLRHAPLYDRKAFVRWLNKDDWCWYSHDPATLRMLDSRYRPGGEADDWQDDNFAYFNRKTLFERKSFLDDAEHDELPPVSWIDPNFVDFRFGPPGSNDDHPPSRVMLGQELVLTALTALARSKAWEKTLFLVVYDEHGGFFDHIPPPSDVPLGDGKKFSYGVRVPALVVSPFAAKGVCKETFEHTSIIKTILLRFASDPDAALAQMGERTANARHLGELLTSSEQDALQRPSEQDLARLAEVIAGWRQRSYDAGLLEPASPAESLVEAVTDLQREVIGGAVVLRGDGVPPGRP
jgi:phospholipase C